MDPTLGLMVQHLKRDGYRFSRTSVGLRADHDQEFGFIVSETAGGVKFRIFFKLDPRAAPQLIIKLTNDLNRETVVSKFYLDADSDFVIDAWLPLNYEANAFAAFMQAWDHDLTVLMNNERAADVLA